MQLCFGVLVAEANPTAAASSGFSDTVNELLIRKPLEHIILEEVGSFDCGGGSKCPARAAASLISDRGDRSSLYPVNCLWDVILAEDFWLRILLLFAWQLNALHSVPLLVGIG